MNQFDLAKEIAISNLIRVLENERFDNIFNTDEKTEIKEILKEHLLTNLSKLKTSTMIPKIEPIQSEADKLWMGERTVNSTYQNEEINSLWGESQHR